MKFFIYYCTALLMLLVACIQEGEERLQNQIDEISDRYAPDKRTALCDAEVRQLGFGKYLLTGETLFPAAKNEIISLFNDKKITLIDSLKVLPDIALGENTAGLITVSVANLRSRASHPAELITQAILGTPVKILKKQSDWLFIQTPDLYLGWTNSSSVQEMTESEVRAWRHSKRLIYKYLSGFIYERPETEFPVADLVAGAIVEYVSESDSHFEVSLPDGRTGFTEKIGFQNFIDWAYSSRISPDGICETALYFTGLPYLWGGTSSKSLDCSGFTKTVYFLNGYIISRDASQQIMQGKKIPASDHFDNLCRGDLLFFGSAEPYRVVHVGIWLGDSEVIHASGMVTKESMDPSRKNFSRYLSETFLSEVRRLHRSGEEIPGMKVAEHPWYFDNL
jgi:gamma-D-glutamyl-L-lysine dipeptidyl-peptidase